MRDVSFHSYSVVSYFKLTINDSYRPIKFFSDGYQRKSPVLPSEAVATLQLQRLSVDVESDMLLVPFAQGQFLPFCLFYICSFHIIVHFSHFIISVYLQGA